MHATDRNDVMALRLDRDQPRPCSNCRQPFVMRSALGRPRTLCYSCMPDVVEPGLPPGFVKCWQCHVPFKQDDDELLCCERCEWLAEADTRWRAAIAEMGGDECMSRTWARNKRNLEQDRALVDRGSITPWSYWDWRAAVAKRRDELGIPVISGLPAVWDLPGVVYPRSLPI
jgi:hypothetical protein